MNRIFCTAALLVAYAAACTASGLTQQDRGHGSIYYSPSGNRIGWARSLSSDPDADHAAFAMCQGGQVGAAFLQEFQNQQAGVSATGGGPTINTVESDCRKIVKFDSQDNHQCGGFGFDGNGNVSKGVRQSDRSKVQNSLSSWSQTFIICNDDRAVSGIEKFVDALGALADALGGSHSNNQNQLVGQGNLGGTAIAFRNTAGSNATFSLKCPGESSYHRFALSDGSSVTIDGSSWGQSCGTYDFLIATPAPDGTTTSLVRQIRAGRSYTIVFNQQKGALDIATGTSGTSLFVVNDTNVSLTYVLLCPSRSPTTLTVASGESQSHHLNCDRGTLQVTTGSGNDATMKSLPVQNGRTYHLHFDSNAQVITIVAAP